MEKKREKAHGCFPVGVDKSNRCEMTYEPRGSAVGEALNLFLSQFTSESDIIIFSSVRTRSLSRPETDVSRLRLVAARLSAPPPSQSL